MSWGKIQKCCKYFYNVSQCEYKDNKNNISKKFSLQGDFGEKTFIRKKMAGAVKRASKKDNLHRKIQRNACFVKI